MVRLKNRYLLFDIVYPPVGDPRTGNQKQKHNAFSESPKEALLQMHEPSPAAINARSIASMLRRVVEEHFGQIAGGSVALLISVKYFSNKTSTGIIRCSRDNFHQVMAAVALVTKVDNYNAVMRCIHSSGTIRKCEQFSIRRNKQMIVEMGQDQKMKSNFDELLLMFQGGDDELE